MRSIWKGAISFGLVSITVALYAATEEKDIRFRQVHRSDGGRIRYQRICSVDGQEVEYDDIAKGYELGDGEIVVLDDDDFANLPLPTTRAIEVLEFVPSEQIDPIMYHKAYYLEPDATAAKPYVLLRDALARSDRVAIVKVALRQREQLATLRVHDHVMVLNTMLWPDEVREPSFGVLDKEYDVRPQELAMAGSLIETMAGDFVPSEFADGYRAALRQVIDAKVAGRQVLTPRPQGPAPAGTVDLMAALRASVDRARASRGEEPPAEPTPISAARSAKRAGEATKRAADAGGRAAGGDDRAQRPRSERKSRKVAERAPVAPVGATAKSAGATGTADAGEGAGVSAPPERREPEVRTRAATRKSSRREAGDEAPKARRGAAKKAGAA